MFGFTVSPCQSCSEDNTPNTYRSFFCGLSCRLSQDYSPVARMLVNRDSTFLSLLAASASPNSPTPRASTCCNPISVPQSLYQDGIHAHYAAAVTICGLGIKLEDYSSDESGIRKNFTRILGHSISPMRDRAVSLLNTLNFPTQDVSELIRSQSDLEKQKPDLQASANPTAQSFGHIFRFASTIAQRNKSEDQFQRLGESLGRLIYWRDAVDDYKSDKKKGRFNPLTHSSHEELKEVATIEATSLYTIADKLNVSQFKDLVQSIVSSTLYKHRDIYHFEQITALHQSGNKKRRRKSNNTSYCDVCNCDCDDCSCCKPLCSNRCCDSLCDCGPGDSGCCDCCPCGD